nr:MAG TPA: Fusolin-binding, LMPO, fibronectin type III.4A [Caudoviricetes sp.]
MVAKRVYLTKKKCNHHTCMVINYVKNDCHYNTPS